MVNNSARIKKKKFVPASPSDLKPLKKGGIGYREFLAFALLIIATGICFSNAFKNDFTNWDDPGYVLNNNLVKSIGFDNIKSMFSSYVMSNYHPLAVLSLAIDYHFYQFNPIGFHTTSIVIHLMNVLLIFLFIRKLTGKMMVAFITALLFGIHPMHVESVSWVSERKDVLYVFFYIASLYAYLVYIQSEKKKIYVLFFVWILFLLSLFSKGQAVTLTLVLFLVDYYCGRAFTKRALLEKLPFFVMSLVFGIVAVMAQKEGGSISDNPLHSFFERVLFASFSFLNFVYKMIVPENLSAYYPYPSREGDMYPMMYYASPFIATGLVFLSVWYFRKRKDLLFGIVFFIVNIFLLLQLFPVGGAMMSERYSYLSYTGLSFIVGISFSSVWNSGNHSVSRFKYLISLLIVFYGSYLGYRTFERNKIWKNSGTLWSDVLRQFPNTIIAYSNRGSYFQNQGLLELAMKDLNEAIRLKPDMVEALVNRSNVHRINGHFEQAIADCDKALSVRKDHPAAYTNRGIAYCFVGRFDEAFEDFGKVLASDPLNSDVYCNRGNIFDMKGQLDSAIADYSKAIQINPLYGDAYYSRAKTLVKQKQYEGAISDFNKALELKENKPDLYYFRSMAYKGVNDPENALKDALTSAQIGKPFDQAYLDELHLLKRQ